MTADSTAARPLLIGWKERLDFPAWGIRRVKAKIDTGARTSALGAVSYTLYHADGGGLCVRLRLAPHRKRPAEVHEVEAPVLRMVTVRNSGGQCEERPLIEADVCLGPVRKRIRLTVTHRPGMLFRLILGRQALAGDFVVDVSNKYLLRGRDV
jgi:hypothetical protein